MERIIQFSSDGSHTIFIPDLQTTYHSKHGAIGESRHVFIEAGFDFVQTVFPNQSIHILEIGFGTGLNALLTYMAAAEKKIRIHYTAIEPFPLYMEEIEKLNYGSLLNNKDVFRSLHASPFEKPAQLSVDFSITKTKQPMDHLKPVSEIHCMYHDVFAPEIQPELWTKDIFIKLYSLLTPKGILVTYCSKSIVRKAMTDAGFRVTKIPGPWGKREMVRAIKAY
jgi:tRNA U34 5-methylaminomethyl-2-thiouridine-forming methyltransferase MnmC